jgi:hypothetical protein
LLEFEIHDGAGPVITEVVYYPSLPGQGAAPETLMVTFSEPVRSGSVNPNDVVLLYGGDGIPKTFPPGTSLELIENGAGAIILLPDRNIVAPMVDRTAIETDGAFVKDWNGNAPVDGNVPVVVQLGRMYPAEVTVIPNPGNPSTSDIPDRIYTLEGITEPTGTVIMVDPVIRSHGKISIYDATGNLILASRSLVDDPRGLRLYYVWNGRNLRNRAVGSGTYLGIVSIKSNGGIQFQEARRVMIGVRRN